MHKKLYSVETAAFLECLELLNPVFFLLLFLKLYPVTLLPPRSLKAQNMFWPIHDLNFMSLALD